MRSSITRSLVTLLFISGISQATAQQYLISTLAGGAPLSTPIAATAASIGVPNGVALDTAGNFYFSGNQCIFKVDRTGNLTRIAGNSRRGYAGDGGPATSAQLQAPFGVAVDAAGNIYIADELNQRIRKVLPNGIIVTVAGNGTQGFSGDGGPAVNAQLNDPINVLVDPAGSLYIADFSNNRIRKVAPNGIITTIAGGGPADPGDNGPATGAVIANPSGMALDASGNLYVADRERMRVRKVAPTGIISTVAGNGTQGYSGDGGPATSAQLYLPTSVAVDSSGDLFIADFANNRIREVSSAGIITTLPGLSLVGPSGVALDATGDLYITDQSNHRVQKVFIVGFLSTVAGNGIESFSGDGGPATSAQLNLPVDVAVDAAGNVYIADSVNRRVRKVSADGTITTVFNGVYPDGLAVDSSGNLYVADSGTGQVSKVTPGGSVTTLAQLTSPGPLAVDSSGDIYVADNLAVRKITPAGTISTILSTQYAAIGGIAVDSSGNVYLANGGVVKLSATGTIATLNLPVNVAGRIALDAAGDIYTATNNSVLKISPAGTITTIAGNGTVGYSGDSGAATTAQLYLPEGIAVDATGRVYVADAANFAVRLLTPTTQSVIISAVVDAASEQPGPVSPGKIVAIYGSGLSGAAASFNGTPAIVLYSSATQLTVAVPFTITGTTAQLTVTNQGRSSLPLSIAVAPSAPSLFSANGTGAGQAVALNTVDGSLNTAADPVAIGSSIELYTTGVGASPLVSVTVASISATVQVLQSAARASSDLTPIIVQIPAGVPPGGYVPIVLSVGAASSISGAVWISVSGT